MAKERGRTARGWRNPLRRGVTALPVTDWEDASARTRVLVECDDDAVGWAMEKTLTRAGYDVATCPGPSPTTPCALVECGRCDLQAGADVIVNCIEGDSREALELAHLTAVAHPDRPLVVDAATVRRSGGSAPPDASLLVSPWSGSKLVEVVDAAVGSTERAPGAPT